MPWKTGRPRSSRPAARAAAVCTIVAAYSVPAAFQSSMVTARAAALPASELAVRPG
jgi:hypothetical protein